jgi:hypothetical protein
LPDLVHRLRSPRCQRAGLDLLRRRAVPLARWVWLIAYAIPAVLLLLGRTHSVPFHVYLDAAQHWLRHEPLYDLSNIDGFQYLPTSAMLFAPLAKLGSPWSELAWRALGWSAYALAIWRLSRRLNRAEPAIAFLLASCLAIGPAVANLQNGQANLLLGALALHASVAVMEQRWWSASAELALGLALKPLMVVPLLLFWALYRPLAARLPLALAVVFALPWLFTDSAYLVQQYRDCVSKLMLSAEPDRQFEDVRGLLTSAQLAVSPGGYLALRAVSALGVLVLAALARKRLRDPLATFMVCSLGLNYLMLFNPRTLSSSYAMTGAVAAVLAARYVLQRGAGVRRGLTITILLAWTLNHHVVPGVQYWLRPLACVAFFAVLVRELFGAPATRVEASPARPTDPAHSS